MKQTVLDKAALAAASTQDWTDAQFSSDLKLQLFMATGAVDYTNAASAGRLGIGVAVGTGTQFASSLARSDAQTGTQIASVTKMVNDACILTSASTTGNDRTKAAVTAALSNGNRVTYSVATVGELIASLMLGGSDIAAAAVTQATTTGTATYDIPHPLGAAPEVILLVSNGNQTAINSIGSSAQGILGAWTNNGVFGFTSKAVNNTDPTVTGGLMTDGSSGTTIFNDGTTSHRMSISNVGSTTFRLTLSSSGNCTGQLFFVVLRGASTPLTAEAGVFRAPGSTGPYTLNMVTPGGKSVLITASSRITAALSSNIAAVTDDQGGAYGMGWAVNDGGTIKQYAGAMTTKAGVASPSTNVSKTRLANNRAILTLADDGSTLIDADVLSMTDDIALNFRTAGATGLIGYVALGFAASAPTPVIANTVGAITDGSSFTITGTGFSASGNSVSVGGVAQTVTSESTTSITCTAVLGSNQYGVPYPVAVTNALGTVDADPPLQFISPASGVEYVTLQAPLVPSDQRITSVPDLQAGWQLELSNVTGGFTVSDVQLYSDGEWIATPGQYTFDVRVNDGTGWGSVGTQTVGVALPSITVQPVNQTVLNGGTATFSVSTAGTVTGYQWYKDGSVISGAVAQSYTTPAVDGTYDGAQYKVRVTNATGFVDSASAVLTVVQNVLPLRNDVWNGSLPGLSITRSRAYLWKTAIQESLSGKESRVKLSQYPRVQFTLQYELLRNNLPTDSELKEIVGLFNAASGAYDSFLYQDPTFNRVTLEKIGTGDGSTKDFQLTASFQNSGSVGAPEIIQNLNGVPTIFLDSAAQSTSAYTIGPTGIVSFVTAPAAGKAIRWSGDFYYRVRFSEDTLEMTQFLDDWWQSKQIVLKSIKL